MTDSNTELPVCEFFEEDGAIGLIVQIDREKGNIKRELTEEVGVSPDTLKKRIELAKEADLLEEVAHRPGDHGRATAYQLTDRGRAVQSLLRAKGVHMTYEAYMDRKLELENAVPDIQRVIREEGWHRDTEQDDWWGSNPKLTDEETARLRQEIGDIEQSDEQTSKANGEGDRESSDGYSRVEPDVVEDPDSAEDVPDETWGSAEEEEEENTN